MKYFAKKRLDLGLEKYLYTYTSSFSVHLGLQIVMHHYVSLILSRQPHTLEILHHKSYSLGSIHCY